MAEGVGFEPTSRYNRETVFKTATIVRSVTPPDSKSYRRAEPQALLPVKGDDPNAPACT